MEIVNSRWCKHPLSGFQEGRYEVKKLYRKNNRGSIDRRIKVGSRGETIYGRYDALIKALALDVENYLEVNWTAGMRGLEEVVYLIDAALERRHTKDFQKKFKILAEAYDDVHMLSSAAAFLDHDGIQADDILRGFSDLDGIFVVVGGASGYYFTLVSRKDIPRFFVFDSVSVEGVKLRYVGAAPVET